MYMLYHACSPPELLQSDFGKASCATLIYLDAASIITEAGGFVLATPFQLFVVLVEAAAQLCLSCPAGTQ